VGEYTIVGKQLIYSRPVMPIHEIMDFMVLTISAEMMAYCISLVKSGQRKLLLSYCCSIRGMLLPRYVDQLLCSVEYKSGTLSVTITVPQLPYAPTAKVVRDYTKRTSSC